MVSLSRWWRIVKRLPSMTPEEAGATGFAVGVLRRGRGRRRAISFLLGNADALLQSGRSAEALVLYREAARAGHHDAVVRVINWPGVRDDDATVHAVYREAIAAGDLQSLAGLADLCARRGDEVEARRLYRRGEQIDDPVALIGYGRLLARTLSRPESADAVSRYRRQAAAGHSPALAILGAYLLAAPGGETEAEAVLRHGTDLLDNRSRSLLAALLLRRGAVDEASQLIEQIRATGTAYIRAYAEALAKKYDLDSTTG